MAYRRFFLFEIEVADDERAFLRRNGRFQKLLGPGKYTELDFHRELQADVVKVMRAEVPVNVALMMKASHPEIAEDHFAFIQTGPSQVAIISFDGDPGRIVGPNTTKAFWKTLTKVSAEMIDANDPRIEKKHLEKIDLSRAAIVRHVTVEPHEVSLLIIDGQIHETLGPGRYAFWNISREIRLPKIDMRPQPLEVSAQDVLTKDRVTVSMTLTASYRIIDAVLSTNSTADLAKTITRIIQFAVREAISTRSLNDILASREEVNLEIRAYVVKRVLALGTDVTEIGVKELSVPDGIAEPSSPRSKRRGLPDPDTPDQEIIRNGRTPLMIEGN